MKKYFLLTLLLMLFINPGVNVVQAMPELYQIDNRGVLLENKCDLDIDSQTVNCHLSDEENVIDIKYVYSNSTNEDINATFVLPFVSNYNDSIEDGNYSVLVDSKSVDCNIRYTYNDGYFDADVDISKINNDYVEGKIASDAIVYKHTYYINKSNVRICFSVDSNEDIFVFGDNMYRSYKYNANKKTYYIEVGYDYNYFDLYFVNYDVDDFLSSIEVYSNNDQLIQKDNYSVLEESKEELTFKDLAFKYYDQKSNISQIDWYNAIQDKLNGSDYVNINFFNIKNELYKWVEYSILISSNSKVSNEISFPAIFSYEYYYSYLNFSFNFSKGNFRSVKSLDINIETPYYIANYDDYSFHYDNPDDFVFSVRLSETIYDDDKPSQKALTVILIIAISIMLIPLIVIIICMINSMKKNRIEELKSLKINLFIQVILSYIMLIVFSGLFAKYSILLIVFILIELIFSLYEMLKLKHKCVVKIVVLGIQLFFVIMSLALSADMTFNVLLNLILLIINIAYLSKVNNINDNVKVLNKNTYYSVGALSNKNIIVTVIECVLIAGGYFVLLYFYKDNTSFVILGLILTIVLLVAALIVSQIIMSRSDSSDFKQFDKDLDYKKLENNILSRLSDPKINPETVNYYKMLLSTKAICVSLEKYEELQKEIFIPKNPAFLMNYNLSKLNYLLSYDDLIKVSSELKKRYASNKAVVRKIDKFVELWKAYWTGECKNIDKLAPYETKNDFENAINLFVQIGYYKCKNETTKVNELKALFLLKYRCLQVLIDELDGKEIRKTKLEGECFCCYCGKKISTENVFCPYCGKKVKDI